MSSPPATVDLPCLCGRYPEPHKKQYLCGIGFNEFLGEVQHRLIKDGYNPPLWPQPKIRDQGDVDEALDVCVQWCKDRLDGTPWGPQSETALIQKSAPNRIKDGGDTPLVQSAEREKYGDGPGATHWDGCWKAHHGCAIHRIESMLSASEVTPEAALAVLVKHGLKRDVADSIRRGLINATDSRGNDVG